jgi:hypothetical protein
VTDKESFIDFLREISVNTPKDAIELRSDSAKIISRWLKYKYQYPHEMLDPFVYIESSIEDSIEHNLNDAVALQNECKDAYTFHINPFIAALAELQSFVEGHR